MSKPHITDLYFHDELSTTIGLDAANTWFASLCRRSFSRRIVSSQRLDDNKPSGITAPRLSQYRPGSKAPSPATNSVPQERLESNEAVTEMARSLHQANISADPSEEGVRSSFRSTLSNEDSKPETRGLIFTDAAHTVFDRGDQAPPPAPKSQ